MRFFKNKEDMFKNRAERFEQESKRYEEKGNTEKANWASEQKEHNQSQAVKQKGQEGWKSHFIKKIITHGFEKNISNPWVILFIKI